MIKNYFSILRRTFSTEKLFIKNKELPICSNCIHFIEHINNYPYDSLPDDKNFALCKRFGEIDVVTGNIQYDLAKQSRNDNNKCGLNASEYIYKRS
jgi:hypothetical protein